MTDSKKSVKSKASLTSVDREITDNQSSVSSNSIFLTNFLSKLTATFQLLSSSGGELFIFVMFTLIELYCKISDQLYETICSNSNYKKHKRNCKPDLKLLSEESHEPNESTGPVLGTKGCCEQNESNNYVWPKSVDARATCRRMSHKDNSVTDYLLKSNNNYIFNDKRTKEKLQYDSSPEINEDSYCSCSSQSCVRKMVTTPKNNNNYFKITEESGSRQLRLCPCCKHFKTIEVESCDQNTVKNKLTYSQGTQCDEFKKKKYLSVDTQYNISDIELLSTVIAQPQLSQIKTENCIVVTPLKPGNLLEASPPSTPVPYTYSQYIHDKNVNETCVGRNTNYQGDLLHPYSSHTTLQPLYNENINGHEYLYSFAAVERSHDESSISKPTSHSNSKCVLPKNQNQTVLKEGTNYPEDPSSSFPSWMISSNISNQNSDACSITVAGFTSESFIMGRAYSSQIPCTFHSNEFSKDQNVTGLRGTKHEGSNQSSHMIPQPLWGQSINNCLNKEIAFHPKNLLKRRSLSTETLHTFPQNEFCKNQSDSCLCRKTNYQQNSVYKSQMEVVPQSMNSGTTCVNNYSRGKSLGQQISPPSCVAPHSLKAETTVKKSYAGNIGLQHERRFVGWGNSSVSFYSTNRIDDRCKSRSEHSRKLQLNTLPPVQKPCPQYQTPWRRDVKHSTLKRHQRSFETHQTSSTTSLSSHSQSEDENRKVSRLIYLNSLQNQLTSTIGINQLSTILQPSGITMDPHQKGEDPSMVSNQKGFETVTMNSQTIPSSNFPLQQAAVNSQIFSQQLNPNRIETLIGNNQTFHSQQSNAQGSVSPTISSTISSTQQSNPRGFQTITVNSPICSHTHSTPISGAAVPDGHLNQNVFKVELSLPKQKSNGNDFLNNLQQQRMTQQHQSPPPPIQALAQQQQQKLYECKKEINAISLPQFKTANQLTYMKGSSGNGQLKENSLSETQPFVDDEFDSNVYWNSIEGYDFLAKTCKYIKTTKSKKKDKENKSETINKELELSHENGGLARSTYESVQTKKPSQNQLSHNQTSSQKSNHNIVETLEDNNQMCRSHQSSSQRPVTSIINSTTSSFQPNPRVFQTTINTLICSPLHSTPVIGTAVPVESLNQKVYKVDLSLPQQKSNGNDFLNNSQQHRTSQQSQPPSTYTRALTPQHQLYEHEKEMKSTLLSQFTGANNSKSKKNDEDNIPKTTNKKLELSHWRDGLASSTHESIQTEKPLQNQLSHDQITSQKSNPNMFKVLIDNSQTSQFQQSSTQKPVSPIIDSTSSSQQSYPTAFQTTVKRSIYSHLHSTPVSTVMPDGHLNQNVFKLELSPPQQKSNGNDFLNNLQQPRMTQLCQPPPSPTQAFAQQYQQKLYECKKEMNTTPLSQFKKSNQLTHMQGSSDNIQFKENSFSKTPSFKENEFEFASDVDWNNVEGYDFMARTCKYIKTTKSKKNYEENKPETTHKNFELLHWNDKLPSSKRKNVQIENSSQNQVLRNQMELAIASAISALKKTSGINRLQNRALDNIPVQPFQVGKLPIIGNGNGPQPSYEMETKIDDLALENIRRELDLKENFSSMKLKSKVSSITRSEIFLFNKDCLLDPIVETTEPYSAEKTSENVDDFK